MKKDTTSSGSATKGFAILSVAGIINKVLSVLYVPILMQIVGDDGYGIYSGGYQIYTFIYVLTNSGFPIAISKLQSELIANENYRDARRSFKLSRLLLTAYGLVMTIITAVFARQITSLTGYDRSYLVILALSPTMLFSAISSAYRGYFNGNSNMKPTAMSQIVEQFLNVTLSLLFAYLLKPMGLEYACAGATVGTTIGSLGSAIFLGRTYGKNKKELYKKTPRRVKPITSKSLINKLLTYSIPIALNSVIIYGGNIVDLTNTKKRLTAAGLEAVSYAKYGALNKYSTLLNVPAAITAALQIAMIPSFSAAIAKEDYKLLKKYVSDVFRISLLISIPCAVGLGVLSKPLFEMLFPSYIDGWYLMAIGSCVVVLIAMVQIQSGILQCFNKTNIATLSMLAGIFVKIFINYFLIAIPEINITGAVIGTIVSYIISIIINNVYIQRNLPAKVVIKKHLGRPIIASAAMAIGVGVSYKLVFLLLGLFAGVYISNALAVIFSILVGIAVYGIVMLKIGGLTARDFASIPHMNKIKRFIPNRILAMAKTE